MESKVFAYSSGIDSYIAYKLLNNPSIIPVYVAVGSRYNDVEIHYVKHQFPNAIVIEGINLSRYEIDKNAFIPNRNLLIATCIVNHFYTFLDPKVNLTIYFANHRDDRVSDSSPNFYEQLSKTLSTSMNSRIHVFSPIEAFTKETLVNEYINRGFSTQDLVSNTFSCYFPKMGEECLNCKACFRKNITIQDFKPRPFYNVEIVKEAMKSIEQGSYTKSRSKRTLEYLNKLQIMMPKKHPVTKFLKKINKVKLI